MDIYLSSCVCCNRTLFLAQTTAHYIVDNEKRSFQFRRIYIIYRYQIDVIIFAALSHWRMETFMLQPYSSSIYGASSGVLMDSVVV